MLNNSYGRPCPECGRTLLPHERLHLDHIVPTSLGGADHPSNLRVVHGVCNLRKGNKLPPELWVQYR